MTRLTGGEMTIIRWHDIHLYTSLLSHNVQSGLNSHDKLKLANSCSHQCGVQQNADRTLVDGILKENCLLG